MVPKWNLQWNQNLLEYVRFFKALYFRLIFNFGARYTQDGRWTYKRKFSEITWMVSRAYNAHYTYRYLLESPVSRAIIKSNKTTYNVLSTKQFNYKQNINNYSVSLYYRMFKNIF